MTLNNIFQKLLDTITSEYSRTVTHIQALKYYKESWNYCSDDLVKQKDIVSGHCMCFYDFSNNVNYFVGNAHNIKKQDIPQLMDEEIDRIKQYHIVMICAAFDKFLGHNHNGWKQYAEKYKEKIKVRINGFQYPKDLKKIRNGASHDLVVISPNLNIHTHCEAMLCLAYSWMNKYAIASRQEFLPNYPTERNMTHEEWASLINNLKSHGVIFNEKDEIAVIIS